MGLVAAIIVPGFYNGLSGIQMETAGRDLVTHMKQARARAIADQRVIRIVFASSSSDASRPAGYALADEYQETIRSFSLPRGISIQPVEKDSVGRERKAGGFMVSFYPNGRSSGGAVLIKGARGREAEVVVDPVTGFAHYSRGAPEERN